MPEEFTAEVTRKPVGSVVVLTGTVDKNSKEALEGAYRQAAERGGEVVLDFGGVDYINSTGIAVIVGILATARAERREVAAVGLTDHYREVFRITRLSDFMHIYEGTPAGG